MNKEIVKSNSNPFMTKKRFNMWMKLRLSGLVYSFKICERIAPLFAERMALRLFLNPPRHTIPEWQKSYLKNAKKSNLHVGNNVIKMYQWGSGPAVLLVHGWGGRGSQLSAFISPLINAGYSVLTFDGPAHGDSSGKKCDMFDFASVINAISNHFSIHSIVSHSFGSACTLLALSQSQINISKLILIGCPYSAIWIAEAFGKALSISDKTISAMRKKLENQYENKWTWEDLSLTKLISQVDQPILLVHDLDDLEIPYQQVLELQKSNPRCQLFTSMGQGHRRILRSENAINKIVSFINY